MGLERHERAGSGLELLPRAKALRPDVPRYHKHGLCRCGDQAQALERGVDDLLTKPIDFPALRYEIDTRVERAA